MDDVSRLFDAMADAYDELEPWYEHLYARVHAIIRQALPRPGPPGSLASRAIAIEPPCRSAGLWSA